MALTDAQKQKVVTIDGLKTYHDQMVDTVIPGLIPETPSGTVPIDHGGTGATTAAAARTNLGLGSLATKSSLAASDIPSITKSKISDFPSLGTAAAKDVPSSGNASSTQVVMGNDSRLTNSRPASDVSSWAKASSKPSYTLDEVTDGTSRKIPTKVSELTNDSGFTTNTGTVTSVKVGSTSYNPSSGVVSLPAYPTTLPASDVSAWAKASSKPSYSFSEISGTVSSSQLPAYVDDVIEGYYKSADGKFYSTKSGSTYSGLITGESGKVYVDIDTNQTFRCSNVTNQTFTPIKGDLALGETSSTAYRGDRGKTAYDHSQSTHARTDATAVAASSTNGNIKINGTETTVYTHPTKTAVAAAAKKVGYDSTGHVVLGDALTKSDVGLGNVANQTITVTSTSVSDGTNTFTKYTHPGSGTNPHGTTKSDVGLGNVGNFLAVSTVASQGLTDTQKSNARANIGAGTSSFSGSYNDLSNKPTIPTKVSQLTNDSGFTPNTGTVTQVKVGSTAYNPSSGIVSLPAYPTSLPASDVSSWAKASSKPSYAFSEITGTVANSQLDVASATDIAAIFS